MTPYQDAADRFQAASADFADALRQIGSGEKKKTDPAKWLGLGISLVSLALAGWSAYGARELRQTGQQLDVLRLIKQLADVPRVSAPAAGTSGPGLSVGPATHHYFSIANQIEVMIEKDGFSRVDVNNFVSLMQATLAFRDVKHAGQWWARKDTIKDLGRADLADHVQMALLYADYARMTRGRDTMREAAARLAGLSANASGADRIFIDLSLTQLYANMTPRSAPDLQAGRQRLDQVRKGLEDLKSQEPAAAANYDAQYGPQIVALQAQLDTIDNELKAASRPKR